MLRGFNYPLTPKGQSTLNPPPPWYYSADYLDIEFWADSSAVASLLPAGLIGTPLPMAAATLSSTIGSSAGTTRNILIQHVISIASSSFSWMRCSRADRSRTAPTSSWTTMPHSPAVGLRAIRSVSARCSRPGITRQRARPARPCAGVEVRRLSYRGRATTRRGPGHPEGATHRPVAICKPAGGQFAALSAPRGRRAGQAGTSRDCRERPAGRAGRTGLDRRRFPFATRLQRRRDL